jgi:hypothetical protein
LEIYADEVDEGNIITGQASQHGQEADSKDDVHIDVGYATSHRQFDTDAQESTGLWKRGIRVGKAIQLLLTIFT